MSATATTLIEREKVQLLNDLHRQVEEHRGQALRIAIEAGNVLLAIKAGLAHGEFGPWLEEHFEGSDRTARVYMQLAQAPDDEIGNGVTDLSIRQAREQIVQPRRLSAGEIGDTFRGGLPNSGSPAVPEVTTWTDSQLRKDGRATELLTEARSLQESAQDLTDKRAIARAYRDAAVRAQRAAATLDELAISFE